MNDIINVLKGVVLLEDKTYQSFLTAENVMKRGIYILFVCFLIIALPAAVGQMFDNIQPFTEERAADFQEQFFAGYDQMTQFMPQDEEFQIFIEQFRENFEYGLQFGVAIDALPRPLPRAAGVFLQTFGGWISSPFTHLGAWIGYAIWVLLFAKMTGGLGGVNRFLGLTALYAVPNLLGFLAFIPYVGGLFSLVGIVWGWVVYVKAVSVSQEFSGGKAVLIAILPVVVLFIVILVVTLIFGLSLAAVFGSGQ